MRAMVVLLDVYCKMREKAGDNSGEVARNFDNFYREEFHARRLPAWGIANAEAVDPRLRECDRQRADDFALFAVKHNITVIVGVLRLNEFDAPVVCKGASIFVCHDHTPR